MQHRKTFTTLLLALSLSTGCASLAPLASKLGQWAIEKAGRVAACSVQEDEDGKGDPWSKTRALDCLGSYATDRHTPACERANDWVGKHPE